MILRAAGIEAAFDPSLGIIERFAVEDGDRTIAPLHRAPWVDSGEAMPEDVDPHLARLGGDFFCAPFAAHDGASPLHGWPPNAAWQVDERRRDGLAARLTRLAKGATVTKGLRLIDGHPFLYQAHVIEGGAGRLSFANHANLAVPNGARIFTSPKAAWETPATAPEPDPARGRSLLRYPARTDDPTAFPGAGGDVDLTRYPWGPRHEDFVSGLEAEGNPLGWTAVVRPAEGDLYLALRDPIALPMTMLWHSNGGRDYPPWLGRHHGCLGLEEGAASHMLGLSSEAALTGPGALALGARNTVRHVIGALAWPSGEAVENVTLEDGAVRVDGAAGARRRVAVDPNGIFGDD